MDVAPTTPPLPPMPDLLGVRGTVRTAVITALQGAVAAENAAVYGYGLAGAHLTGAAYAIAQQYWTQHRAATATLAAALHRLGAQPHPPADAYRMPFPVGDAGAAVTLAGYLEDGVTRAYLALVAVDDTALRLFGARAMQVSASRAAYWHGHTVAFPGLAEDALRAASGTAAHPGRGR